MERKLDELGRLVIPMEFRKTLGWGKGVRVNMNIEGERVIVTKSATCCSLCGARMNLKDVKGVKMCQPCIDEIKVGTFRGVD